MAYRHFKRLLGESSLERKCRFLFGAATLVLVMGSFWWYAWNTEDLAYQQAEAMSRLLVGHALYKAHAAKNLPANLQKSIGDLATESLPQDARFSDEFITASTMDQERQAIYRLFRDDPKRELEVASTGTDRTHYYPLRATETCLRCHTQSPPVVTGPGQLIGVAAIKISVKTLEERSHFNRAIMGTTATVTALLLMSGSYLIVRYVIVKPVAHLKEVSDAITAGQLNIRSEIQTGDEFEDLSHAYNRMLRSLVSMQEQLKKVNADLDHKVDQLAQANMALYTSGQLKSDFLATMSHELRTPLHAILGFSDLLAASPSLTDKQRKWIDNITSSGKSLLALINDILDLAKSEAGKMVVRPTSFDIREVVEHAVALARPLADQKNIALEIKVDPGLPAIWQDGSKIQQILGNLLSNAVKFTPEGGRVGVTADSDGANLILSVTDTGVGIAPEDQELIFDKFRQVGRTALTREHAGTGLGLSIVRELAKLLGGDVRLKSDLGRGSTFTVTVPLRLLPDPRLGRDTPAVTPMPRSLAETGASTSPAP